MDITLWYKFDNEWHSDWSTGDNHIKLVRTSPYGGLIAVLTVGEGISRKLRIYSGTGSLLTSIQWVVKWMLDAGWTYTLQFVTLLSNGTVRVCTLNVKRRQQFTLPFRPIAGKVYQDGFILFEANGTVHFVSYHNIECLTNERLCTLGQLQLLHGEIPITIVPRREIVPDEELNLCFSIGTCHKNLIICKAIGNKPSSLICITKNLGYVVRNGMLDFYKSIICVTNEDVLSVYSIDIEKFDEIVLKYTIKLGIIPNSIYITTKYVLLNTDNQMYIKYYGEKATNTFESNMLDDNLMISNTLLSDDEIYPIGPSSECHIIGFYYINESSLCINNDVSIVQNRTVSYNVEEGIRLFYPALGQVWLIRSNMDWYKDILENIDNSSYKLLEAYKTFSDDSSEAFNLKINFDEAIHGCIKAASATLDLQLSELYLEAVTFGRKLNGFASTNAKNTIHDDSNTIINYTTDITNGINIDSMWAVTCGWLRIIRTISKSPLDQYITVSEAKCVGVERLCEMISARGYPKIAFAISKFSNCSPHLAYQQYALSEIISSSHLPDNELINTVFNNTQIHGLPNGVFAKLSKIAVSPPFSRNTLALSLYDKERCIYSKASLANSIPNNNVKINHFPTDLIRIMIDSGIQLPLYHRHYKSKDDLKTSQRILERMGLNNEAAINATIIGFNCINNERNKEAKNWFGYSQSFSKASKNQLLYQSADEIMIMLKYSKYNSVMELIFDLFMKNDHGTALNIGNDLGISKKRLGICLVSTCIIKKDINLLNKYIKDKRIEIPQQFLEQAYGHIDIDDKPNESNSFFRLWR